MKMISKDTNADKNGQFIFQVVFSHQHYFDFQLMENDEVL